MSTILIIGEPGTGKTRLIYKYLGEFNKVLWITTTKSADIVRKEIEATFKGINLWIVDTHTWQRRPTHTTKDLIVSNPLNLNEVSLAIGKALDNLKSNYFLAFDSISGLLLYHPPQKLIHFLRNIVVRVESENSCGIFTLVKNAHDIHTETSVSLIFSDIMELERQWVDGKVKRFLKIIRASEYVPVDMSEFKITENGIELPDVIDAYIRRKLGI